jgi:hypothetical protein
MPVEGRDQFTKRENELSRQRTGEEGDDARAAGEEARSLGGGTVASTKELYATDEKLHREERSKKSKEENGGRRRGRAEVVRSDPRLPESKIARRAGLTEEGSRGKGRKGGGEVDEHNGGRRAVAGGGY